jgi:hypothetical protein
MESSKKGIICLPLRLMMSLPHQSMLPLTIQQLKNQ